MVTKLFVPDRRIVVPKPPSYLKLDMAFAIGAGAKLMDKSRYRSHATIVGADWADGAHGRCLDFVGAATDYVEIAAAYDQLNFTSEDFSLIMRVYIDDLSTHRWLFTRGEYTIEGYTFYIASDGRALFFTTQAASSQSSRSLAGTITAGAWLTLGVSRDGASVRILKNGVDITTTIGTHQNPDSCDEKAYIGTYQAGAAFQLDGKIEFLRIFGGIALTASEHLAWHNALK